MDSCVCEVLSALRRWPSRTIATRTSIWPCVANAETDDAERTLVSSVFGAQVGIRACDTMKIESVKRVLATSNSCL